MDEIISRKEAKKLGLKMYFTGTPCKRGHISHKYTSNFKCLQCSSEIYSDIEKEKQRERYRTDPVYAQRIKDRSKAAVLAIYQDEEKLKKYRQDNAEWARQKRLNDPVYVEKQRECSRKTVAVWKKNNPEKHRAYLKARKAMLRANGYIKAETIRQIISGQNSKCNFCGIDISGGKYHLDHIIPLKLGGTNDIENLQGLCAKCNLSKAANHPDEWKKQMESRNGR